MSSSNIFDEALRLSNLNKWTESNAILSTLSKDHANTTGTQRLFAKNYRHLGDFSSALIHLDQLLLLKADDGAAQLERGICLESLGLKNEALAGLNKLVLMQPRNPWALLAWLRLRAEKESVESIISELHLIKQRLLPDPDFNTIVDQVRTRLIVLHNIDLLIKSDSENILELNGSQEDEIRDNLRKIYSQFESLGNDCEFGFAQRKVGAEPMSLFRWSGIEPHHLMSVMENQLTDFDKSENYTLEKQDSGQYFLKESKYGTVTHTHITAGIIPEDVLLKRMIERQTFLKRKLLSDIDIGTKVFVYRFYNDPHDDYVLELVKSLQGIGIKRILICRKADSDHAPGTSREFSSGVILGYLSTNYPDTPFKEWDEIVQNAYEYFKHR